MEVKNLTKEQKEWYDNLEHEEDKQHYLNTLEEEKQEESEFNHSPTLESKEIIEEIKDQNPQEVEKEEKKKQESAKHQKRRIKKASEPEEKKEGSTLLKVALGLTFLGVAGYVLSKKKPLNKTNMAHDTATTGQDTVASSSVDHGLIHNLNDGGSPHGI